MKIHYTKMRVVLTTLLMAMSLGLFAQTSCPTTCLPLKTYTQGGWGAAPSGNNVGTFLDQNFAANFPAPAYLTIGCTNKLQLTSAAAVRAFLPNGTTPALLPAGTSINKTKSNFNNVLAGQLVALCLNITFDKNIAGFASATPNLKDQVIASGPFAGKTVQFLYDNANLLVGGCAGYFKVSSWTLSTTLSQYTTAIDYVNRNNDNGGVNLLNFLACPLRACCTTTNILCNGAATGSMSVTTGGGLAPFTYSWSVPAGQAAIGNVASASGLKAGTYTVTVNDAAGMTATTSCTVSEPSAIVLSANGTNPLCSTGAGSITFGATGGTGAISYTVNGTAATSPYTAAASGTYTIVAKDANNCTKSTTVTIAIPSAISLSANGTNPLCSTGTGSITFGATGGTGEFSYTVNGDAATSPYTATASGVYTIVATDANGCTKSTTVTIAIPSAVELTANGTNPLCSTGAGSITFGATGGTGAFSYTVNDAAATSPYAAAASGTYTIVATDANGCTKSATVTIAIPTPVEVSLSVQASCLTTCANTASASANGGTPDYSYSWKINGSDLASTSADVSGICLKLPGNELDVRVIATDANGCKDTADFYEIYVCECSPLKTFTQGGWGAVPNGGNPGVYLHANFDAAFPTGVTLGCTNTVSWTSAQAITDWLPSGTTADALPEGNLVDPTDAFDNVLAAQLLAATLNVGFDAYDADFSANDGSLGGRYFADGAFAGMTVNDVIQWANDAIGGCDMHGHTFAEYNAALTDVNENYDNGNQDLGHLTCTSSSSKGFTPVADAIKTKVFPNPASTEANVTFEGKIGQVATIAVYDLSGRMLMTQRMPARNGVNQFRMNVSKFVNQTYAVKVIVGASSTTSLIVVQH